MAQLGLIVRGLIASPMELKKYRDAIRKSFAKWNAENAHRENLIFEAVGWETHATGGMGAHPQKILNKDLCQKCDFVIAMFGTRLGAPTDTMASGTIEEIDYIYKLRGGDRVFVYFLERNSTPSVEVDQFKVFIQGKVLYEPFRTNSALTNAVSRALSIIATRVKKEFDDLYRTNLTTVFQLAPPAVGLDSFRVT